MEQYLEVNYHQPSDEMGDDWSFDGMIEDTVLNFLVGVHVAEQDGKPAWKPGDEFEAARLEALAALEE